MRYLLLFFNTAAFLLFHATTAANQNTESSKQCLSCHTSQYSEWLSSDHASAMAHITNQTAKGVFDGKKRQFGKREITFFKNTKGFWAKLQEHNTDTTYQISYTFGHYPLQQYMVTFDDGRIQLLPFAWDARPKTEGGQRWFDLYPNQTETTQDFYWKNTGQNWNYMCADCHSTEVSKNYDSKNNQYNTEWKEINVGCRSCHGNATEHLQSVTSQSSGDVYKGFDRTLSKQVNEWIKKPPAKTLQPKKIAPSDQTLTCAKCHSRHTQISENQYLNNQSLNNRYILSLIGDNYYPDGQVYNETFVYGSFIQSKMHQKGVVCSNCHNPHSGKLIAEGNNLCLQCHESNNYNSPKHHFHEEQSTGSKCVNCHMPETTFMQIDQRADHSFKVPRPDLALRFGTPDSCLNCHSKQSSHWSDKKIKAWYPKSKYRHTEGFTLAFAMADSKHPSASEELTKIAQDKSYPDIIRASALQRMENYPDRNSLISIARAIREGNPLILPGAIKGAESIPPTERWELLSPLLTHKDLSIRSEAAQALASNWPQLSEVQKQQIEPALNDYFNVQKFNSDRGFSWTNMANIFAYQGKDTEAINFYNKSISLEPYYINAHLNLAEIYRRQHNPDKELFTLQQAIKDIPNNAMLHYTIGLYFIRNQQKTKAKKHLLTAKNLSTSNDQYAFVYALIVEDEPLKAYQALEDAYAISKNPRQLYALCEMKIKNKSKESTSCLQRLEKVAPKHIIKDLKNRLN